MLKITNRALLCLLLIGSIGVTVAVAFILWPTENWDANFYINLSFICIAEAMLFGWPLVSVNNDDNDRFILGIGMWGMSGVYLSAVFLIAIISKFTDGYKFSLTANLICALALSAFLVSWKIASRQVSAVAVNRAAERNMMNDIKKVANLISSQLSLVESKSIKTTCESLIDAITYARSNSNAGCTEIDTNIASAMDNLLKTLQSDMSNQELLVNAESTISAQSTKIKAMLSEREATLKMGR